MLKRCGGFLRESKEIMKWRCCTITRNLMTYIMHPKKSAHKRKFDWFYYNVSNSIAYIFIIVYNFKRLHYFM